MRISVLVLINQLKMRGKRKLKHIFNSLELHLTADIAVLQLCLHFSRKGWRTGKPQTVAQPPWAANWVPWASRWSGKKGTRLWNPVKSTGWDRKIQLQSCWSEIWRWKTQGNTAVCVESRGPRLCWQSMVKKPFSVGVAVPQGVPFLSLLPSCFGVLILLRFLVLLVLFHPLSHSLSLWNWWVYIRVKKSCENFSS